MRFGAVSVLSEAVCVVLIKSFHHFGGTPPNAFLKRVLQGGAWPDAISGQAPIRLSLNQGCPPTSLLQLTGDGRVGDLRILRQEKRLAEDDGQGVVPLERQEDALL